MDRVGIQVEKAQGHVQQIHADLASLDAVISQFDPDYPVGNIRPRYTRAPATAEFGAMSRTVLDLLRKAGAPLTGSLRTASSRSAGLNAGDRDLRRNMVKRVGMALCYQRTKGMVAKVVADGVKAAWEIVR